ncbi:MAG: hypothetical protein OXO52_17400 [Rhodospirillales bacterium]|nr:hypothetical protein [Rhodospirillales bacterium]MDE0378486.1 hypothetical protein [Rhodospirillales bacterium]
MLTCTARKHRRGAGAVLGALLLAALSGAALAIHYEARERERGLAFDRAAGQVFAAWVMAAHRATQAHADAFETALDGTAGILLTVARLKTLGTVPPGLPERPGRHASMTLGAIPDGSAQGIPMAFGVLEPGAARASALRVGALQAGLAAVAPGGGTLMERHRPAIEAVLGRALATDTLYVTADRGIRYRERALHRRTQPGRPWLNRMETALDMAPPGATDPADPARRDLLGASAVSAEEAAVDTDISVGGTATVGGGAEAANITTDTVEAGGLQTPALGVTADLVVGVAVTGPLVAGTATIAARIEADALQTAGALDAAALSAAGTATIDGTAAAREFAGERLEISGTLGGNTTAAGGVYGPDAYIAGLLTVGTCKGCEGE